MTQRHSRPCRPAGVLLLVAASVLVSLSLAGSSALACGGAFGEAFELQPQQHIVVRQADGVETYVFNPSFCGAAAEFGLILPVPGTLTANPELVDAALLSELVTYTAPAITYRTECIDRSNGLDGLGHWDAGGFADASVDVIDSGQVGIFEWTLLQAQTAAAFTDWLDANGYPYDLAAATIFDYYVGQAYYFVAFKVTAGDNAPPAGSMLCGELGPIGLSFQATEPVVPARIASVAGGYLRWKVHVIAPTEVTTTTANVVPTVRFSGALTQADLDQAPLLAAMAQPGERVTELLLDFDSATLLDDIRLDTVALPTDYRAVEVVVNRVSCGDNGLPEDLPTGGGDEVPVQADDESSCGCHVRSQRSGTHAAIIALLLAAVGMIVVRRRRR